eukprot:5185247-Amphidinium_carterae.1
MGNLSRLGGYTRTGNLPEIRLAAARGSGGWCIDHLCCRLLRHIDSDVFHAVDAGERACDFQKSALFVKLSLRATHW